MYYKEIIEKYYSANLLDSFLNDTNEAYNKAKGEKEKYLPIWNEFVVEIKKMEAVTAIRDTYYSSYPDTGKITIGIDKNCEEGVTFNLSFRTMQMGIYYCHYKEKAKVPICEEDVPVSHVLSYYPYNQTQEKFAHKLIELADSFFPNFKLFNNAFAACKAKNVTIQTAVFKEYDYFRVFFDDAIDGIS
jgi:hypothetical protein